MKKLFLRLGLITALSLALFSCDKADTHQNLIPKDADVVLMINPAQIAEKANLSSDENIALIEKALSLAGDSQLESQVKELIKNPEKTGVDIKAPVYGFINISDATLKTGFGGISLKLKDVKDFKQPLFSNNAKIKEYEVEGFKIFEEEGDSESLVAIKDNQALIFFGEAEEIQAKLKAVLSQKEGDSFAATKLFAKMNETQEDFEAIINYGKFVSLVNEQNPLATTPPYNVMLEEVNSVFPFDKFYYTFALNSEKGALKFSTGVYADSDEYEDFIKDWSKVMPEADGTFIDKMPKNSLFAFNFTLKGAELWKIGERFFPKTLAEIQEKGKEDFAELGVTLADIVKLFDGDMAFSVAGSLVEFQQQRADMRGFIQLGNTETAVKLLDKVVKTLEGAGNFSKIDENQYLLDAEMPVRFGLKDKVFFVGTKKVNSVDELFEDAEPNIKENSFADKFEDRRLSMVINVSEIVNLAKPFMGFVLSSGAIAQLEQIDYISSTEGEELTQSETILKLKNDKNPYALLLDIAREVANK